MKCLPYILLKKYINILALEMARRGTGTVPVVSAHFRSVSWLVGLLENRGKRRYVVLVACHGYYPPR